VAGGRTPCERCPLRAMPVFRDFSPDELDFVRRFKSDELDVDSGATLVMQGSRPEHLYTVLSGWAFRHRTLPDGRRQIVNYVFPGDFVGLQGSMLDEMEHSVEALTDLVLCVFPREKLWSLYNSHPTLAY